VRRRKPAPPGPLVDGRPLFRATVMEKWQLDGAVGMVVKPEIMARSGVLFWELLRKGTSQENGPNYLLEKPRNIHTLLDDLAMV
jgi:hypothetical protein